MMLVLSFQCINIFLLLMPCHTFTVSYKTARSIIHERTMMATPLFQSREEDAYGSNVPDPNENISTSPHLRAIEEAMEATRKYGATSKEARVAWEIAEEIEDSIFSPCSKRYVRKNTLGTTIPKRVRSEVAIRSILTCYSVF